MERTIEEVLNREPEKSRRMGIKRSQNITKNYMIDQCRYLVEDLRELANNINTDDVMELKEYNPMSLNTDEGFDYKTNLEKIINFRSDLIDMQDYFNQIKHYNEMGLKKTKINKSIWKII